MPSVGRLLATERKKVDRIQAMQMFMRVAEAGSFVRAAETLSLPASTVTSTIKNLKNT